MTQSFRPTAGTFRGPPWPGRLRHAAAAAGRAAAGRPAAGRGARSGTGRGRGGAAGRADLGAWPGSGEETEGLG